MTTEKAIAIIKPHGTRARELQKLSRGQRAYLTIRDEE